jgi:hypothetical protein
LVKTLKNGDSENISFIKKEFERKQIIKEGYFNFFIIKNQGLDSRKIIICPLVERNQKKTDKIRAIKYKDTLSLFLFK